MIKNVVFDLGNVLIDLDWEGLLEDLGYVEDDVFDAVASATVLSPKWKDWDRSAKSVRELTDELIDVWPFLENEIENVVSCLGEAVIERKFTRRWIRDIISRGYGCYYLSNYPKAVYDQSVEELSFTKEMDGGIFSFEIKKIKPEPEIYNALLEKYDLKASECVFIDDRKENTDMAQELGFTVILFDEYENVKQKLEKILV